jgi:uncharacterized protein
MDLAPQLYQAKVMHRRLFPRVNGFAYSVYYLACPLSQIARLADGWRFGVERFGLMGFYAKDHGARDGSNLQDWARRILQEHGITTADGEIILIAMPRILGYGFNPVSFWLCLDKANQLRAVINEVHNTFGEHHSYLCAHANGRIIAPEDRLTAQKLFHVSPFLERSGYYRFRYQYQPDNPALGFWIDYCHEDGRLQLITSLLGRCEPYTRASRRRAFWSIPWVTVKTIALIHWQALKIISKKIRYIPKPVQQERRLSASHDITGRNT